MDYFTLDRILQILSSHLNAKCGSKKLCVVVCACVRAYIRARVHERVTRGVFDI